MPGREMSHYEARQYSVAVVVMNKRAFDSANYTDIKTKDVAAPDFDAAVKIAASGMNYDGIVAVTATQTYSCDVKHYNARAIEKIMEGSN